MQIKPGHLELEVFFPDDYLKDTLIGRSNAHFFDNEFKKSI